MFRFNDPSDVYCLLQKARVLKKSDSHAPTMKCRTPNSFWQLCWESLSKRVEEFLKQSYQQTRFTILVYWFTCSFQPTSKEEKTWLLKWNPSSTFHRSSVMHGFLMRFKTSFKFDALFRAMQTWRENMAHIFRSSKVVALSHTLSWSNYSRIEFSYALR